MNGMFPACQYVRGRAQEMSYSEEQLDRIYEDYGELTGKKIRLMGSYLLWRFREKHAEEHARHGFCRRLQIMAHCIMGVFEKLPPESDEVPGEETVSDATIYLQAFVFNTFGSIDNLAQIWVSEMKVKQMNGNKLRPASIGFGKKYTRVMESLPREFRDYLDGLDAWLEHLTGFRHALAHRIPLYIPPSFVTDDDVEEYRRTEAEIQDAIGRKEFAKAEELENVQNKLISFLPVTTHSFKEQSKFVLFHYQMLADFHTVEEIGWRMLRALEE